jgi:hypothetical protein
MGGAEVIMFAVIFTVVLAIALAGMAMVPTEPTRGELAACLPSYHYEPPIGPHVGPYLLISARGIIELDDREAEQHG